LTISTGRPPLRPFAASACWSRTGNASPGGRP